MHHTHYLWFQTKKRQEIVDITGAVAEQVRLSGVREGWCWYRPAKACSEVPIMLRFIAAGAARGLCRPTPRACRPPGLRARS